MSPSPTASADAPIIPPPQLRIVGANAARPDHFLPLQLTSRDATHAIEVWQPEVTLGRHSEADVRLVQPDVSRFHCKLAYGKGGWTVADLTSLNGTLLNGKPVRTAPLRTDDVLRVGPYLFHVEVGGGATTIARTDQKATPGARQVLRSIARRLPAG
jgi:pSer/pThr/pTyr-binding forkhead associated (FHA) protein